MRDRSPRWACAVGVVVLVALGHAAPAAAQDAAADESRLYAGLFEATPILPPGSGALVAPSSAARRGIVLSGDLTQVNPLPPRRLPPSPRQTERGPLLPVLYTGFGVLQALDAHSTLRAVDAGHREANPMMAPFANQPAAMIGVKAATAAGTIYMVDRLARRNRVAATVLMVALNGAYAAIVSANYRR
jgi:hypothetical protein